MKPIGTLESTNEFQVTLRDALVIILLFALALSVPRSSNIIDHEVLAIWWYTVVLLAISSVVIYRSRSSWAGFAIGIGSGLIPLGVDFYRGARFRLIDLVADSGLPAEGSAALAPNQFAEALLCVPVVTLIGLIFGSITAMRGPRRWIGIVALTNAGIIIMSWCMLIKACRR